MTVRFISVSIGFCSLSLWLAGNLTAQLPQAPLLDSFVSPEARLEMMEKTYATNLRPIHGPVMQDYLRELELLKNKMTASGRAAESLAVDAEIARIRQAMSTTGTFPFVATGEGAPADPAKATTPEPAKPASEPNAPRTVLTLQAAKANGNTLAAGSAAPLGSLDWTVEKLAAGTYDVAMVFACAPMEAPEKLTLSLAGVAHPFTLPADRSTGSVKDFRIFRFGTVTVEKDVAAGNLRLQSEAVTPKLMIRSVILSRPKVPAPRQPGTTP
ncbi:hypothetical protein DES53_102689 [Roseimicrobium gellanilyticum]|uniref:Uncharacterized protein n=1 Tax=Roseimicrobium gellanilyticum TaxID=748857 RepID=A0A366HRJ5_9BACT|nr:hypothetical protein [Roseimicrobium gellanilyticum]RBP46301.1 hypothetical protein DES53_102689 [Roseimicrobium gellanilyticum]